MDVNANKLPSWQRGAYTEKSIFDVPWLTRILVYFHYFVILSLGALADWLRGRGFIKDFAPLHSSFESSYINNIYRIASDVCNRPLAGVPGAVIQVYDRESDDHGWTQRNTGDLRELINLGSYNYLGFARSDGPCAREAARRITTHGVHIGATRAEYDNASQQELEECIADFLGVEAAVCFPMGFGTSATSIPAIVDKDCLVLSDELNHASAVLGCRLSGARIRVFRHNDPKDAEKALLEEFIQRRPKKILIIIEGIYSMDGTIVNLPAFIELKKRYKAYLYVDEAHSIGSLGATGRGIVEYWGCDPLDVDLLMGTLTKSFAAVGGYIAGRKVCSPLFYPTFQATIQHLRLASHSSCYGASLSPPIATQALTSMKIMSGADGTNTGREKMDALLANTRYFRRRLQEMGFLLHGHEDSPVVPVLTYFISKVVCFGRETLRRGIGMVSVGYPATPLTKSRARFTVSADHTREQLDYALSVIDEVGRLTNCKYGSPSTSKTRNPEVILS